MKKSLRSLMCLIGENKNHFLNLLESSDLIIEATSFTGSSLAALKEYSDAPLIGNHAGSPEAYSRYWIRDDHLLTSVEGEEARYLAWCQRYDGLLFQSHDQAEECIRRKAMADNRCYVVLPTCREDQVLAAKQQDNPFTPGRKSIVCVGSLQPRKAQEHAIEAFTKISDDWSDVDLHFVGGGVEKEYGIYLTELASNLNVDSRVFFHGHRTDYLRFMAHSEMLIQSSRAEGVSRVLREAMLMKLPVVSFAIPGTSSILQADKEALLAEPGNTEELAEGMEKLLDNRKLARGLADAAFAKYLLRHSNASYSSSVRDMIQYFTKLKI